MTEPTTEARFVRIHSQDQAPAVFQASWLPDLDTFPELSAARETLLGLAGARAEAHARQTLVREKIENDQRRRELEMRDAYLRGESPSLEPPDEALVAELAEAEQAGQAATGAYVEQINRCVALVVERREAWFAEIDEYQRDIDEQVQALMEQAARLRTQRGNFTRFELWAERCGGRVREPSLDRPRTNQCGADSPADHLPYSEIAAPPSGDVAEEEARMTEFFMQSYAGFDGKQRPISPEQTETLERLNAQARLRAPEEASELSDLDEEELVDWLMSCGRFDGHPKPGADLTVAAAEGDPAMAARLLRAERTATGDNPRQAVVQGLNQIGGAR